MGTVEGVGAARPEQPEQPERPEQQERTPRIWGVAGAFLAVAFVAAGALGAVQQAAGVPAEVIQLTQFGPAVAVAALALVRRDRVARLIRGAGRRRTGHTGRGAALLATAPLITALAVLAHLLSRSGADEGWFTRPGSLEHSFAVIAAAQLVGACAEEIGWRCLLQPLLRTRFGVLASSVTVGVLWGLWHVPVFALGPVYAAAFLVATVAMSVVLGLALEGTGGTYRLLLAGGFHTLVNLGMLLFLDEESGTVLPMVCFGAACLLAALPWVGWAGWAGLAGSAGSAGRVAKARSGTGSAATTLHGT